MVHEKTRTEGARAVFWLPPRDSEALQVKDFGVFSTVIPA